MIYFKIEKNGETVDFTNNDFQELGFDPKTIQRFTGLKDKQGKQLFEGDSVRLYSPMGYDFHGKIYWSNNHAAFVVADKNMRLISDGLLGVLAKRFYITKEN